MNNNNYNNNYRNKRKTFNNKTFRDILQEQEGASFNYFKVYIKQFSLSISVSVLVFFGLSWSILMHTVYLSVSWSISVYLNLSISDFLRLSSLSLTISGYLKLSQTFSDYLKLDRAILYFPRLSWLSRAISGYIWLSLTISDYLMIYLVSIKYQGATKSRREQVIAIWNLFCYSFFFFSSFQDKL